MKRLTAIIVLLLTLGFSTGVMAQTKKKAAVATPESKILGRHPLSLQWISWDYFGSVEVRKENGRLHCIGSQRSKENDDYVIIDGYIEMIDALRFGFTGVIITKIYHINGGQPCIRDGYFEFASTQGRKYWRLQQMDNPCDGVTDYVDIYFSKTK